MLARTLSGTFTVTPIIDTNIYASGDQVGSLNTIANAVCDNGGTGVLSHVTIVDKAKQNSILTLLFFSALPTLVSSDNAPLDISDVEMDKCLGKVAVDTTDYVDLANNSVATINGNGLVLDNKEPNKDISLKRNIYMVVLAGGSPTYGTTSDLVIQLGIMQD